jgi:hypothetical protein
MMMKEGGYCLSLNATEEEVTSDSNYSSSKAEKLLSELLMT